MKKSTVSMIVLVVVVIISGARYFFNVDILQEINNLISGEQQEECDPGFRMSNGICKEIVGADPSLYIPTGYYDSIDGLTGEALRAELNNLVDGHVEFPYNSSNTDTWDIMKEADEDPNNPDNVITFYSNLSLPKLCQDVPSPPEECNMTINGETKYWEWNREHVWSKSRGDFGTTMGPGTDLHHLIAEEQSMNSTKNNSFFQECDGGDVLEEGNVNCGEYFEPRDEIKGDVARMIFYMAIRYEGENGEIDLEIVNSPTLSTTDIYGEYGDLDDLLKWHIEDPVSEEELQRHEVIYSYQENRNPFIDLPELVTEIFGN